MSPPMTVSPDAGNGKTPTLKSVLLEPNTTIRVIAIRHLDESSLSLIAPVEVTHDPASIRIVQGDEQQWLQ